MRRRMRRRHPLAGLAFLCAAVLLIAGIVAIDGRLRPLVQNYGYMAARRGAMLAVHNGVEQVLAEEAVRYADLVTLGRDASGRILSAEANVTAINRLKAAVTAKVTGELAAREVQTARIPLGSVIGGSLMTGRGPFLPLRIHTSGAVISQLGSEFGDAGINQTNHRITLTVTVMMTAALPGERVSIELTTDFLICETVLVGEVPQTVLQVDFGETAHNIFGSDD